MTAGRGSPTAGPPPASSVRVFGIALREVALLTSFGVWVVVNTAYGLWGFLLGTASLREHVTPVLTYATVPFSGALGFLVLYRCRRWRAWALIYALGAVVAALALFEDLWHLFGGFAPGFGYPVPWASGGLILASWSAFGLVAVGRGRVSWAVVALGTVLLAAFALWFASGYPQVVGGGASAVAFNLGTKALAFAVVIALYAPPSAGDLPGCSLSGALG